MSTVVNASALRKRYGDVAVFSQVNLQVQAGEFVAILGESGVGKSTLLNVLGGLDQCEADTLTVCGEQLKSLSDDALAKLRRNHLGFVFQAFHVLPHLNVAQNLGLPLVLLGQGMQRAPVQRRVADMLQAVGLQGLGERLPAELSGGQLQRVAIARAIIHKPALILADEPTGNLDPSTAALVMQLLHAQAKAHNSALILATHAQAAAQKADRLLRLTAEGLVAA